MGQEAHGGLAALGKGKSLNSDLKSREQRETLAQLSPDPAVEGERGGR